MKHWVNIFAFFLAFIVIILHIGCTKDDSVLPPSVSFSLPIENTVFNVPDSIHVTATISSETPLEKVELRIVNSNYIPVTEAQNVSLSGASLDLEAWIYVTDIYLETGAYYIEISATSSGETKRKYREIVINEYPLMFERACVFTADGNFSFVDIFSDSLEISANPISGELSIGIVDNFNRQIVIGNENGLIRGYDAENHQLLWSVTNNNSVSNEFFNDIQYNDDLKRVYFSDNNGDIRGYNESGDLVDLIDIGDNLIPESFYIDDEHIVVEVTNLNQSLRFLQVFFRSTGSLLTNLEIDLDIKRILSIDDGKFIVIGNGSTEDEIAIFFMNENAFFFPSAFGTTGIRDIVSIDQDNFAIAHSSGIFLFNQSNNDLSLLINVPDADYLEYDPVNELLMVIANNQLFIANASGSSILDQYDFSSSVKGIDILYNK